MAAVETLTILAPIFAPIDRELIHRIVRPYFAAGWCLRDILYAMDYRPDGQTHSGQGASWVRGEDRDHTLVRLQRRLGAWRWSDRDDHDANIMHGPYTSMVTAMQTNAAAQRSDAAARAVQWHEQAEAAQRARDRGAPLAARRAASTAAMHARQSRRNGELRAIEHAAAQIAEARAASLAWLARYGDGSEPAEEAEDPLAPDELPAPTAPGALA